MKRMLAVVAIVAIGLLAVRLLKVVEISHVEYSASGSNINVGVIFVHVFTSEKVIYDNFFKKTIVEGAPLKMSASFDPAIHSSSKIWVAEIYDPVSNSFERIPFSTKESDAYGKVGVVDLEISHRKRDSFGFRIICDEKEIYSSIYRSRVVKIESFNEMLSRFLSV